jgi:hypothetical protein
LFFVSFLLNVDRPVLNNLGTHGIVASANRVFLQAFSEENVKTDAGWFQPKGVHLTTFPKRMRDEIHLLPSPSILRIDQPPKQSSEQRWVHPHDNIRSVLSNRNNPANEIQFVIKHASTPYIVGGYFVALITNNRLH